MRIEERLAWAARQVERIADALSEMRRWRRLGTAFLAGSLSVLALQPFGLWPILFLTIPVLVWLLDGVGEPVRARRRTVLTKAFFTGWFFGFGYFFFGLYWVGEAFLVQADKFAVFLPFAVTLLPAGMAIYIGLAALVARLFWFAGYRRVVVLAVSWTAFEWLRGILFTGFPWNGIGSSFVASEAIMQAAALVGTMGLNLIMMLAAGSLAAFDTRMPGMRVDAKAHNAMEIFTALVIAVVALALIWIGGAARLASAKTAYDGNYSIRIVQPNTAFADGTQDRNERIVSIIGKLLRMSAQATRKRPLGPDGDTIIVWPEDAVEVLLAREPYVLAAIARMLPPGALLITGANRGEPAPDGPPDRLRLFYNSLYVIDSEGKIQAVYDKHHLVPFGEYVPFRHLMARIGFEKLSHFRGSFDTGPGPATLHVKGMPPVSPLICYESIFPRETVVPDDRPDWLVNVTIDTWFGTSSGPYQHLAQARLRAVEQGLPLARSANTGVSAMIDPYGRLLETLPLDTQGVIDARLPAPLPPTLYARLGDGFVLFLGIVLFLLSAWRTPSLKAL